MKNSVLRLPGPSRRRYDEQERREALLALGRCGGNVTQASKLTGIPLSVLSTWRKKAKAGGAG